MLCKCDLLESSSTTQASLFLFKYFTIIKQYLVQSRRNTECWWSWDVTDLVDLICLICGQEWWVMGSRTHPLSSCRPWGISWDGSTGTGCGGAGPRGSLDSPDSCRWGCGARSAWRSSCSPHRWTGRSVCRSTCPRTPCSPRWPACPLRARRYPAWTRTGWPGRLRAPGRTAAAESRGRLRCSPATGLLPLPCYPVDQGVKGQMRVSVKLLYARTGGSESVPPRI